MLGEGVYIIGYLRKHDSTTYRTLAHHYEHKQPRTPFPLAITFGRTIDARSLDSQIENAFNALKPIRDLGADIDLGGDIEHPYPIAVIPVPLKSIWGLANAVQKASGVKTTALPQAFKNTGTFLETVQKQAQALADTNGDLSQSDLYASELNKLDTKIRRVVHRIMQSDVLLKYDVQEMHQYLRQYKLFFRSEHNTLSDLHTAIEEEEPKKFLKLWDERVWIR